MPATMQDTFSEVTKNSLVVHGFNECAAELAAAKASRKFGEVILRFEVREGEPYRGVVTTSNEMTAKALSQILGS